MMIDKELERAVAQAKAGDVVTFNSSTEVTILGNRTAIKPKVLHTGVIVDVLAYHFLVTIGVEKLLVARANILSVGA